MSNVSLTKGATRLRDVESVIETIKAQVKLLDCVVLVNVLDPEVSGVITADDEIYREILPLGDGIHLVLSLGNMTSQFVDGIHEVEI